jgi:hypothetical protein
MPKKLSQNINTLARLLYQGKIKASDIDADTLRLIANELMKGALQGYGEGFADLKPESADYKILSELENNIHVFSGAKNIAQLQEMSALLRDEKGNLVPFIKFMQAVKAIDKTYNQTYLAAEYDLALQSAQQAEHWQRIQENKDIFPYLKYNAILDGRETVLCHNLDGIKKPVDDPFWNTRYPPNHWRCRSIVDAVADDEENKVTPTPDDLPEYPAMFNNNVGKSGEIFPASHPYFQLPENEYTQVKQEIGYLLPNRWENFKKFKALKLNADYKNVEFNKATGGFKASHKKQSLNEIQGNELMAEELMNNGYGVQLLEDINNVKSADAEFNLKGTWEFKCLKVSTQNAIQKRLSEGRKQARNVVLRIPNYLAPNLINDAFKTSIKYEGNQPIDKIILLFNGKSAIITRTEILNGRSINMLNNIMNKKGS